MPGVRSACRRLSRLLAPGGGQVSACAELDSAVPRGLRGDAAVQGLP